MSLSLFGARIVEEEIGYIIVLDPDALPCKAIVHRKDSDWLGSNDLKLPAFYTAGVIEYDGNGVRFTQIASVTREQGKDSATIFVPCYAVVIMLIVHLKANKDPFGFAIRNAEKS